MPKFAFRAPSRSIELHSRSLASICVIRRWGRSDGVGVEANLNFTSERMKKVD